MGRRQKLQTLLTSLMAGEGKAYYQPETNIKIDHPCIIYMQDQEKKVFAGNRPYANTKRWQIEVIYKDPDSDIHDRISALPMSSFQRHFISGGLYHTIYSLYF